MNNIFLAIFILVFAYMIGRIARSLSKKIASKYPESYIALAIFFVLITIYAIYNDYYSAAQITLVGVILTALIETYKKKKSTKDKNKK